MKLGNRSIAQHAAPYVIAEMSANHNGSLERALQIVRAASESGAHAIKLQTYTAETMTMRGAYRIDDPKSLWHGYELYDLYEKANTPWEWHKEIFREARERGIVAFSSAFDASSVEFLEKLDVPCYKVASFENTDHPLLQVIGQTGKPVILSTGAATLAEIAEAVEVLYRAGCNNLVLLHCTSTYPADPADSNIITIPHMHELFGVPVGLSDHTPGTGVALAATGLGAAAIEKHVTLARADGGVDSAFSLEPDELRDLVIQTEICHQALGSVAYRVLANEEGSRKFKRYIYVAAEIEAGQVITENDIRVIRPSLGLAPKHYERVLGRKAARNLAPGTPLQWEDLI